MNDSFEVNKLFICVLDWHLVQEENVLLFLLECTFLCIRNSPVCETLSPNSTICEQWGERILSLSSLWHLTFPMLSPLRINWHFVDCWHYYNLVVQISQTVSCWQASNLGAIHVIFHITSLWLKVETHQGSARQVVSQDMQEHEEQIWTL